MFSYSSIELSSFRICLTVISCSLVTLLVTYYFNSLPSRFYVFTFLFCGTDDAHLSEINIPVSITVARFLWKTSVILYV